MPLTVARLVSSLALVSLSLSSDTHAVDLLMTATAAPPPPPPLILLLYNIAYGLLLHTKNAVQSTRMCLLCCAVLCVYVRSSSSSSLVPFFSSLLWLRRGASKKGKGMGWAAGGERDGREKMTMLRLKQQLLQ